MISVVFINIFFFVHLLLSMFFCILQPKPVFSIKATFLFWSLNIFQFNTWCFVFSLAKCWHLCNTVYIPLDNVVEILFLLFLPLIHITLHWCHLGDYASHIFVHCIVCSPDCLGKHQRKQQNVAFPAIIVWVKKAEFFFYRMTL